MWSYPVVSAHDGPGFNVAYLQAVEPLESINSSYQLVLMDRDGSNAAVMFPQDGEPSLAPQTVAWSPNGTHIALTADSNLWVLEIGKGLAQQLTGDGQTSAPSWAR
jgi:Tol biopolymer transport system component